MNKFNKIKILILIASLGVCSLLFLRSNDSKATDEGKELKINSPSENFEQDLIKAQSHAVYENRAWDYAKVGNYKQAAQEYKKALEAIENMPGDKWPNLKKEDVDRMNQQTRIDAQIFSRYGLVEALEKTGQYEEALQSVDWLIQNQHVKGKEELLKQKLEGMKQNILQKMQSSN